MYLWPDYRQRTPLTNVGRSLSMSDLVEKLPITQTPAAPASLLGKPHNTRVSSVVVAFNITLCWCILHHPASYRVAKSILHKRNYRRNKEKRQSFSHIVSMEITVAGATQGSP